MKAATVSGDAGMAWRPASAHQPVKRAMSPRSARSVFAAKAPRAASAWRRRLALTAPSVTSAGALSIGNVVGGLGAIRRSFTGGSPGVIFYAW
jgi:hypothetical protein